MRKSLDFFSSKSISPVDAYPAIMVLPMMIVSSSRPWSPSASGGGGLESLAAFFVAGNNLFMYTRTCNNYKLQAFDIEFTTTYTSTLSDTDCLSCVCVSSTHTTVDYFLGSEPQPSYRPCITTFRGPLHGTYQSTPQYITRQVQLPRG